MRPWIQENQELYIKIAELEHRVDSLVREKEALKLQCEESCHDSMVEELRAKYQIPRWMLSVTSYEVLERKSFQEIEEYMVSRARMMKGNKPK